MEAFWPYVQRGRPDECWPWTRCTVNGYGQLRWNGKKWIASRLAYTLAKGPIPAGLCVLHSCDNPACCNPQHLRCGTNLENIRESQSRGISRRATSRNRGDWNPAAKLDWPRVNAMREMRRDGNKSYRTIAAAFGVSLATAHAAVVGKAWKPAPTKKRDIVRSGR